MNKSQFIDAVAEKAQMSKSAAARVVDAIFNTTSGAISEAVNTVGQLSIPGFGKFTTKKRAARTGRNPRTGTAIQIPERTSVSFSAGKGFKESVGGSGTARKGGGATKGKSAGGTKSGGAAKKGGGAGAAKKTGGATKTAGAGKTAGATKTGGGTKRAGASKTASTARKSGGTAKKSGGGGNA